MLPIHTNTSCSDHVVNMRLNIIILKRCMCETLKHFFLIICVRLKEKKESFNQKNKNVNLTLLPLNIAKMRLIAFTFLKLFPGSHSRTHASCCGSWLGAVSTPPITHFRRCYALSAQSFPQVSRKLENLEPPQLPLPRSSGRCPLFDGPRLPLVRRPALPRVVCQQPSLRGDSASRLVRAADGRWSMAGSAASLRCKRCPSKMSTLLTGAPASFSSSGFLLLLLLHSIAVV